MSHDLSLKETKREWHGTLKAYAFGFVLSLLLTGTSFYLVLHQVLSRDHLIYTLIGLSITQALVQIVFFLHLGKEAKPRWETLFFVFTVLVLLIVLIGSLWIMNDLDHRMMSHMGSHD